MWRENEAKPLLERKRVLSYLLPASARILPSPPSAGVTFDHDASLPSRTTTVADSGGSTIDLFVRLEIMVMRRASTVAVAGTVVGVGGAIAGSRLLTTLLFGITPSDPVTLVGVSVLLPAIAAGASYVPARRATAIKPARALRAE